MVAQIAPTALTAKTGRNALSVNEQITKVLVTLFRLNKGFLPEVTSCTEYAGGLIVCYTRALQMAGITSQRVAYFDSELELKWDMLASEG